MSSSPNKAKTLRKSRTDNNWLMNLFLMHKGADLLLIWLDANFLTRNCIKISFHSDGIFAIGFDLQNLATFCMLHPDPQANFQSAWNLGRVPMQWEMIEFMVFFDKKTKIEFMVNQNFGFIKKKSDKYVI